MMRATKVSCPGSRPSNERAAATRAIARKGRHRRRFLDEVPAILARLPSVHPCRLNAYGGFDIHWVRAHKWRPRVRAQRRVFGDVGRRFHEASGVSQSHGVGLHQTYVTEVEEVSVTPGLDIIFVLTAGVKVEVQELFAVKRDGDSESVPGSCRA